MEPCFSSFKEPAEYTTHSAEETEALGKRLGTLLPRNAIVCFYGELGAGKTTFIKGMASGVTSCNPDNVNSPTYVYLNVYEGKVPLYHFDLYRLPGSQQFLEMGFDDYFSADGVCCIEWSEKLQDILPAQHISIHLVHAGQTSRRIMIQGKTIA